MKGFRQSRQQRAALKARGIKPGKRTASNPHGQASGGWSPFAAPAGQMDVADDVEYEAFDRVKGEWITYEPKE